MIRPADINYVGGTILESNGLEVIKFSVRVVGISHEGRDEVVRSSVTPGLVVFLEREPTNPYDPGAVKVTLAGGISIGYIPRDLAATLGAVMVNGSGYSCFVSYLDNEIDYVLPTVEITCTKVV